MLGRICSKGDRNWPSKSTRSAYRPANEEDRQMKEAGYRGPQEHKLRSRQVRELMGIRPAHHDTWAKELIPSVRCHAGIDVSQRLLEV